MFRLFLVIALLYVLYRLVKGALAPSWNSFRSTLFSKDAPPASRVRDGAKVIDEMMPCAACGTFHPSLQSYRKKGLYFCNRQCHEAYQAAAKRGKA